ncbi:hypothetical protein [Actinomadura sp. SCN-SB]|uniref:hypothetical protein n=1 Tax=Actinomadura sp. SCN-SB TaxID=3373092 RepID=UPI0037524C77
MEPGHRLIGRYRLDRRLDGGEPGEVWRAWDESLHRPVAVRLPCPERADGAGPDAHAGAGSRGLPRERLVRAVRVTHPAFVTIYDCDPAGELDGGPVAFVVTALPNGESLAARLERGPLPVAEALDCCAQVAAALEAAHGAGMAHGALRTDKIFLTLDGVRIVDLGVGPEGDDEAKAADMAAFGSILLAALGAESPGDLPGMPEEIRDLCARCLEAGSADRPTASQAAETLAGAAAAAGDEPDAPGDTLVHEAPGPPPLSPVAEDERTPVRAPAGSREAGPVLRVAVSVTVLAAALAVILMLADRGTMSGAFEGGKPARTPSPASSPATPAPGARSPVPEPAVYDTLGRLQPIVDGGRASGAIRPDVAVDLNNAIVNLRNDLAAGRTAEASAQLRRLREKIDTRLRERALDARVAARMDEVLAAVAP